MKITKIKIDSFGALRDREFTLAGGLNLAEGENEAGKTSLAMFIKFMLYGLSGRASEHFPMGERRRFINWDTGRASGSIELECDNGVFRIERSVVYTGDGDAVREKKSVIAVETGTPVKCPGEPGEMFLGVPESVFVNTVFVRQLGTNSIDNAEICSAVENILGSADEKISVKKVIGKLDSVRRQLRHKNSGGGEIPELEEQIAVLESELARAEAQNTALIAAESALDETVENIAKFEADSARLDKVAQICEDLSALRERDRLRETLAEYERSKAAFTKAQKSFPGEEIRTSIAKLRAELDKAQADSAEAEEKLGELRESAQTDTVTAGDCDSAGDRAKALLAKAKSRRMLGAVLAVCAVAALGATVFAALTKAFPFVITAAVAAVLLILSIVFFASASGARKKLGELYGEWGADSAEELDEILAERKDRIYSAMLAAAQIESAERDLQNAADRIAALDTKARDVLRLLPSLATSVTDRMDCAGILDLCEKEAARISDELTKQREEVAASGGKCQSMASNLDKYDFAVIALRETELSGTPEWDEAESLDQKGIERLHIQIKMNRDRLKIAYNKRTEYESILAEGRATAKSPADIAEELEAKRALLEEKKLRFDAIRLAIDTLEESGERLRAELMPRIVKKASAMFAASTMGKYSTLGVSSAFDMTVSDGDVTRSADYLSAGSADAAYVCLRLALADALFGKKSAPLIFDESFAKIDEGRTERLFSLLGASGLQTVVFTCRQSEKSLASGANVISL